MEFERIVYSKNGLSIMELAKKFLGLPVGERIPTVTEFNEMIGQARGTTQNAIRILKENHAIELEARGHLGTYLIKKNYEKLLAFAGIDSIVGVMPLPYSKRYEGFASGIIVALENQYNVPASMAYMRGAKNRVSMLLSGRYDFAVVSNYTALELQKNGIGITIAKKFGEYSYLSNHVVAFHSYEDTEIKDGMKVGIDDNSVDHVQLTKKVCQGKKVEFVSIGYTQILKKVIDGELDVAVWNEDEITDKLVNINYTIIEREDTSDTEAVIVVDSRKKEIISFLEEMIDADLVLTTQKLVIDRKIDPSY